MLQPREPHTLAWEGLECMGYEHRYRPLRPRDVERCRLAFVAVDSERIRIRELGPHQRPPERSRDVAVRSLEPQRWRT